MSGMGGYALRFFGLVGAVSDLEVLDWVDKANLSKKRHGTCSMSEVPHK